MPHVTVAGMSIAKTSISPTGFVKALTLFETETFVQRFAVASVLFGSTSHPASIWHVAEQQSPLVVLPSSHCSAPALMLSPQVVAQTLGILPVQVQPVSTAHVALQPSPLVVLLSS